MQRATGHAEHRPETLDDLEDWVWAQLLSAAANKRSPFNTPALATISAATMPAARTVVLRAASRQTRTLTFHTDNRSAKRDEIATNANLAWLFWHPGLNLQIRVAARASVHVGDHVAAEAWTQLHAGSRALYLNPTAPGTNLPYPHLPIQPHATPANAPPATFAVVETMAREIETLEIGRTPHRRARICYGVTGERSATWLAP